MSDNTFTANLKGNAGTETITNFATMGDSSTALVGSTVTASGTVESSTNVKAGTFAQIGDKKYIFITSETVEASVVAEATAIAASISGSIALGAGSIWAFTSDTAATQL